jgi:hypothetical protein
MVREDFIILYIYINGWYRLFPSASFTTALFDVRTAAVLAQVDAEEFLAAAEVVLNILYLVAAAAAAGAFSQSLFMRVEHVAQKSTLNKN